MLDNNVIQSVSAWPFVEIRKLLKERKDLIKSKKKLFFRPVMDRAVYHILELLVKSHEQP